MNMKFRSLLCVGFFVLLIVAPQAIGGDLPKFTVHGRLCYYNGTPSPRIWIVGTHRILGVTVRDNDPSPDMPPALQELLANFDRRIYADFVVVPFTPARPGVMQYVRIESATRIVVVENGKIILLKDRI